MKSSTSRKLYINPSKKGVRQPLLCYSLRKHSNSGSEKKNYWKGNYLTSLPLGETFVHAYVLNIRKEENQFGYIYIYIYIYNFRELLFRGPCLPAEIKVHARECSTVLTYLIIQFFLIFDLIQIRSTVQQMVLQECKQFKAVMYKTQLVAGINYAIKVGYWSVPQILVVS